MTTLTDTKSTKQTINQLLDKFFEIPNDSMTVELGETCQVLKDLRKMNPAAAGLIMVEKTNEILKMINATKPW